jgi:putative ATP-dependent endonuclease of OLD family
MGHIGREPTLKAICLGLEDHPNRESEVLLVAESLVRVELIHVRNFRGIGDCVLTLEPDLTLLVGRNSAGKSRLLRALALACGSSSIAASADDFSVGSDAEPQLDLVLAPASPDISSVFDDRIKSVFGQYVQLTSVAPATERVAWRTTIRRSDEGWGARSESRLLTFDAVQSRWVMSASAASVTGDQRRALAADLVETGRDLAAEMSRRGSAIRRVLDQLEVPEEDRAAIEEDLYSLGGRIVDKSATLAAVRSRLTTLQSAVAGIGKPEVLALPGRLEELVRMVEVAFDNGSGDLPMRLHGSGARSLASLQVQGVLYDRRLGRDGTSTPTHPLTLVEEPEAHLHPQACFELESLLSSVPGQIVATTHSSHLVTTARTNCLRLVRTVAGATNVQDLNPVDALPTTPAALRIEFAAIEWEKIKRYVERPFGELLFASAIVIGDGATERSFLPYLLKHALAGEAAGICVIDPGGMNRALTVVKYADAIGIPCFLFVDCDQQGREDEAKMPAYATRIWATGERDTDGTIDEVLADHDPAWVVERCDELLASIQGTALERLKKLKGTYGGPLGRAFVEKFADETAWPAGFRNLLAAIRSSLSSDEDK